MLRFAAAYPQGFPRLPNVKLLPTANLVRDIHYDTPGIMYLYYDLAITTDSSML